MGMAPVDAFYFALSSTTATGYGDFTPEGRLPVLATIPFLWTACGAFAAMLEACHNYAKLRMVQKTPLVRVIDQLLLQPTPWDATAGGDHHMHAARAETGAGLSEAEFMLACLCGHGLVGVPTLAALRKQFSPSRRLLSGTTWTAGKQPAVRTAGARVAAAAAAAAAASERRRLFLLSDANAGEAHAKGNRRARRLCHKPRRGSHLATAGGNARGGHRRGPHAGG